MSGTLIIRPIEAKLNHDHDTLGKMDPYCKILIGGQTVKGQTCTDGGKNPKWNDTITAKRNGEPNFHLELYDDDTFKDDIIGVAQIDLHNIQNQQETTKWYPVFYKQKPAGEILIQINFTSDGGAGTNQQYQHKHQYLN